MDQDQQERYDAAERIRQIEAARLQHSPNQPSEVKQIVPQEAPPSVTPQIGETFPIKFDGVLVSKGGNNSLILRGQTAGIFSSPDAQVVITYLSPGNFDLFTVGQTYKVELKQ